MDDLCRKLATVCPDIAVKKKINKKKVKKIPDLKEPFFCGVWGFFGR